MKSINLIKQLLFILLIFCCVLFIFAFSSCNTVKVKIDDYIKSSKNADKTGTESKTETSTETNTEINTEDSIEDLSIATQFTIAYFEITSSEESDHFEHRVANIYSVKPDATEKRLVYSDIAEKYDLGPVYSVSPDGTKILGMLNEGGRGLYSALVVINVEDGSLKKLVEFDFTDNEATGEVGLGIYGEPVWSNDSKEIAFEMISYPFEGSYSRLTRDVGIHIVDIESGITKEVEVDVGGASARSTTFLYPVLFSADDKFIYAVSHPYFEKTEEEQITGFYTLNDTLYSLSLSGGQPVKILSVQDFGPEGPEIIQSFDNFKLYKSEKKIVFQVLGDFEEDGDIWSCNYDGSQQKRLTADSQLREQQPDVFENTGQDDSFLTYIGSGRYGTISSEIPSGDVYIIKNGAGSNLKLTSYNFVGASSPVISPDGKSIAFLYSKYDSNLTYVEENIVKIYNLKDGTITESLSGNNGSYGYIFNVIGWIKF